MIFVTKCVIKRTWRWFETETYKAKAVNNFLCPMAVPWTSKKKVFCLKKKKKVSGGVYFVNYLILVSLNWGEFYLLFFLYCSSCRYKQRNIINVFENMVHVCVLFLCTISSSLIYSASFKKHVCDVKISNWQKNIFCTKTFFYITVVSSSKWNSSIFVQWISFPICLLKAVNHHDWWTMIWQSIRRVYF